MAFVFDFDKTLTDKDTLFGFYRSVYGDSFSFKIKRLALLMAAVSYKFRLIDNDRLKRIGVLLFLKGKTKTEIDKAAKSYASSIQLNDIYRNDYLKLPKEKRMIVSASFEDYLAYLFPGEQIIASRLDFMENKVRRLALNVYGMHKVSCLKKIGVDSIDLFYTDSFSDKPLMDLSREIFLIKNGVKTKLK